MNIIEKLNSIDIKDIKFDEIVDTLKNRLDISINISCVLVTLVSLFFIFNNYKTKNQSLSAEILHLNEIQTVIKKEKALKKIYNDILTSFPQELQRDKIADIISEYAIIHGINIQSFAPAKETADDLKTITNINIKISSNNYKNIILFIKDIENSPYALRVERWNGTLASFLRGQKQDPKNHMNTVTADVHIGALKLQ